MAFSLYHEVVRSNGGKVYACTAIKKGNTASSGGNDRLEGTQKRTSSYPFQTTLREGRKTDFFMWNLWSHQALVQVKKAKLCRSSQICVQPYLSSSQIKWAFLKQYRAFLLKRIILPLKNFFLNPFTASSYVER